MELDKIKARIEEDRDTDEHCIDIDHADWLVSKVERLLAEVERLRNHAESADAYARMILAKQSREVERLQAALDLLVPVARIYLDAFDSDLLSLTESLMVTEVRDTLAALTEGGEEIND